MSSEIKVGLFTIVSVAVLTWFLLNTRDAPFGPGQSYSLWSVVPSAEGIQLGSQVTMAGVKVGRVGEILLTDAGKARVELQLDRVVRLPVDSKMTVKSMGLLGDRSVHLLAGQDASSFDPGGEVPFTTGESDLDELTRKMSAVSDDVKSITEDLKAISSALKTTVTEGPITGSLESIARNLEAVSASMRLMGEGSQGDVAEIVENLRQVTVQVNALLAASQQIVAQSGDQVKGKIDAVDPLLEQVNQTLASLNTIVQKIEQGEGTVGQLLSKDTTISTLNQTLETASDLVDRIDRFKTTVEVRGDYYLTGDQTMGGSMKNALSLTLANRKDYYYLVEVVSDPLPDFTVTTTAYQETDGSVGERRELIYSDAYQFTFQFARRFEQLALRVGLRENHGAVGADYYLLQDRIALSADLYDFLSRPSRPLPNLELRARMGLYNHIYLASGLEDVLNRAGARGVNLYFGAGLTFRDDDLKYLLSVLPIP